MTQSFDSLNLKIEGLISRRTILRFKSLTLAKEESSVEKMMMYSNNLSLYYDNSTKQSRPIIFITDITLCTDAHYKEHSYISITS